MRSDPHKPRAIDGVTVGETVVPQSAEEIAAILADASQLEKAVIPVGGGTSLALGNPPRAADFALSTRALSGVIDYEPTDLVLSVGAGARFGDVQAVLGEHGQRLPLDPAGGDDATIGGLIATARWGPLRHSAGTLRDLLIGISVAHPSGTVTKAGGMVVKNVTGYDMPRLYHGSLGTLGVITSANFKVLPRPRPRRRWSPSTPPRMRHSPPRHGSATAGTRPQRSRSALMGADGCLPRASRAGNGRCVRSLSGFRY